MHHPKRTVHETAPGDFETALVSEISRQALRQRFSDGSSDGVKNFDFEVY